MSKFNCDQGNERQVQNNVHHENQNVNNTGCYQFESFDQCPQYSGSWGHFPRPPFPLPFPNEMCHPFPQMPFGCNGQFCLCENCRNNFNNHPHPMTPFGPFQCPNLNHFDNFCHFMPPPPPFERFDWKSDKSSNSENNKS